MFSMFVAGWCAAFAVWMAVEKNAWGAIFQTVLCGLNLYVALRYK